MHSGTFTPLRLDPEYKLPVVQVFTPVGLQRRRADAIMPAYATDGAACFDLYTPDHVFVGPTMTAQVGTGWAFEVPEGYVMLIFGRSGHAFKDEIKLSNCVGVIDSDYRGEVAVKLRSDGNRRTFERGEAIAQALLLPVPKVAFEEREQLSATDRGEGGFGSTDRR